MSITPPPTDNALIEDASGNPSLQWLIFFNSLFAGDAGESFVPLFNNLVAVGGLPKVTGQVYQLSAVIAIFVITVTPPTNGSTTCIAGQTFIQGFPLKCAGNGVCFAVSGNLGGNSGMVDQGSGYIFPPTWSAVTVPLTIIGIVQAS